MQGPSSVTPDLRRHREALGWSQTRLAESVGISRQAYSAIEAGRSTPSTEIALRLARTLGLSVEGLFLLEGDEPGEVSAEDASVGRPVAGRVRLARMGQRTLAYALEAGGVHAGLGADAIVSSRGGRSGKDLRLRQLPDRRPAPDLIVAGCDPAFGLVVRELGEHGVDALWVPAGSESALRALERGVVHVAGVHLRDPASGTYNEPAVRRLVPFPTTRISFAVWEQALVTAAGNPLGITGVDDLARPEIRLVNREPGSGARTLLDLGLGAAGIRPEAIRGYRETTAFGHEEVVGAISSGTAEAGIAVRAAALARGLTALTLEQEPYDLVIPAHLAGTPAVEALLAVLRLPRLRSQVEALGGYDAETMGRVA